MNNTTIKVQKVHLEQLGNVYSFNRRVNSVLRTLVALHGTNHLWPAVSDYVLHHEEAKALTDKEIWELYQQTKWIVLGSK